MSPRENSSKVLSTPFCNSIVAMVTDLWCHFTYNSRRILKLCVCCFLKFRQWKSDFLKSMIYYTPGIYAAGYIVFALTFVRSSVRVFVRSLLSVTFVEFTSKFLVKVSLSEYISLTTHQKAFIFEPWVPEWVSFYTIVFAPGLMPRGGAKGQNLGHC